MEWTLAFVFVSPPSSDRGEAASWSQCCSPMSTMASAAAVSAADCVCLRCRAYTRPAADVGDVVVGVFDVAVVCAQLASRCWYSRARLAMPAAMLRARSWAARLRLFACAWLFRFAVGGVDDAEEGAEDVSWPSPDSRASASSRRSMSCSICSLSCCTLASLVSRSRSWGVGWGWGWCVSVSVCECMCVGV